MLNAILDESVRIKELDNYPNGSWFYYQFNVDTEGRISDIIVKSMHLSFDDKQKIIELIKSFEYSELTIFPHNTKRKIAKVSAVLMLSNETEYSRPNNFNDFEQVKNKIRLNFLFNNLLKNIHEPFVCTKFCQVCVILFNGFKVSSEKI